MRNVSTELIPSITLYLFLSSGSSITIQPTQELWHHHHRSLHHLRGLISQMGICYKGPLPLPLPHTSSSSSSSSSSSLTNPPAVRNTYSPPLKARVTNFLSGSYTFFSLYFTTLFSVRAPSPAAPFPDKVEQIIINTLVGCVCCCARVPEWTGDWG